ncbi:MAG: hypothetical protein FWE19_04445 [Oscillospiraceae bacterium]|nr:hypothetical protein [Oscillospiraceae bacterium]
MNQYSEQISSNKAAIRFDVFSKEKRDVLVQDSSFLNYRLAAVEISKNPTKQKADIVWNVDTAKKAISYNNGVLTLDGKWEEGELNKIMVTMLANEMDQVGLHPFHSSAVQYKGKLILIVGGENNHGKSMSQLEACRRGGKIFSTETTVTDEDGMALYGSTNIWMAKKRAKGTERSDLPDTDEGVLKFWDKQPEMSFVGGPLKIDFAFLPGIDGHFDTQVVPMGQYERAYQSYHSLMNFFGLNQLLSGEDGLVMPIVDTPERREARGKFCADFVRDIPHFYMMRAKSPQLIFDEIDKML